MSIGAAVMAGAVAAMAAPVQGPVRARPEAFFNTEKAYAIALQEVCLAAVRDNRPVAELVGGAGALPVDAKSAADPAQTLGVWRLASMQPVYVVAWRDGSCQVGVDRGSPDKLATSARAVLGSMHAFIKTSAGPQLPPGLNRAIFCSGGPSHPVVATLVVPLKETRDVRSASSTVWRWHGDELHPECVDGASDTLTPPSTR